MRSYFIDTNTIIALRIENRMVEIVFAILRVNGCDYVIAVHKNSFQQRSDAKSLANSASLRSSSRVGFSMRSWTSL